MADACVCSVLSKHCDADQACFCGGELNVKGGSRSGGVALCGMQAVSMDEIRAGWVKGADAGPSERSSLRPAHDAQAALRRLWTAGSLIWREGAVIERPVVLKD